MGAPVREGPRNREIAVGVAGCGRMGLPMGQALGDNGVNVTGFDIRSEDNFPHLDMEFDPARFAGPLTHLFCVVRDVAQSDAVLFDAQALLSHAPNLRSLIICSTLPPAYITELRGRVPQHIALIDAPMSGAVISAQNRSLTFILGGAAQDIDDISLLLAAMGEQMHHMGPLGSGMLTKVLNNYVAAAATAATRTALEWADDHNLDRAALLSAMHDSSGQTWFGSKFGEIEFARDGFAADNSIGLLVKDTECATTCAPGGAHPLSDALIATLKSLRDI
jgi:3-hydroxyisobutyrate dehydrogenase